MIESFCSSPETQRPVPQPRTGGGVIRPAVSLAQLCDLDESETPSSHKLIERWESIIQENQQREKSHALHWAEKLSNPMKFYLLLIYVFSRSEYIKIV